MNRSELIVEVENLMVKVQQTSTRIEDLTKADREARLLLGTAAAHMWGASHYLSMAEKEQA